MSAIFRTIAYDPKIPKRVLDCVDMQADTVEMASYLARKNMRGYPAYWTRKLDDDWESVAIQEGIIGRDWQAAL